MDLDEIVSKLVEKYDAVFLGVGASQPMKLGIEKDEIISIVNLKSDPILIGSLHKDEGIYPAYHMNKLHWISVLLPDAPADVVSFLTNSSFEATKSSKKKSK